uniref:CRC-like YABBY protein n=1 Tax=Cabomba caroliniana TaxID=4426 RepID=E9RFE8_CABCA|nr:CRC-like YABBY protein [Cabomba caroliniana]
MEFISSSEHLCYVRCNFCSTVLAVGVPRKRLLDTVTVKCGHCSNLSFITTKPAISHATPHSPVGPLDITMSLPSLSSTSSSFLSSAILQSADCDESVDKVRHVAKPPEKKHRLPSAYNRFMREEIQRLKAADPKLTHKGAFSKAAKNWARFDPQLLNIGTTSEINNMKSPNSSN